MKKILIFVLFVSSLYSANTVNFTIEDPQNLLTSYYGYGYSGDASTCSARVSDLEVPKQTLDLNNSQAGSSCRANASSYVDTSKYQLIEYDFIGIITL